MARDAAGNSATSAAIQVTVSNQTAAPPPATGPVAAYGFNEGSGSTTADASGNKYTATVSGATWTTGKYGNALNFTSSAFVRVSNTALNNQVPFSYCAWIYPRSQGGSKDGRILHKGTATTRKQLQTDSSVVNSLALYVDRASGAAQAISTANALTLNQWQFVCGTYSETDGPRLYRNGAELTYSARTIGSGATVSDSGDSLYIGNRGDVARGWDGLIDEVRVYNRVLSSAEILTLMTTPIGSTPSDTQPPIVSISAPANGATVSGSAVTVSATASDNVGVVGVQFRLDGANLGSEDTSAPYSLTWNTTTIANGAHSLTAVARDAAGNSATSAAIQVTVSNQTAAPPPATGPVAAYGFNEGSGSTTADASGNKYTATVSGATWTTGKYGNALSFNGGTGKVVTGLTGHASQRTYMLWTYRTGPGGSSWGRMFDKNTGSSTQLVETLLNDDAARVYRYERLWSGGRGAWTIPQPSANAWHHIAVVYDASSKSNKPQIYVDGVAQAVTQISAPSGSLVTNTDAYVIGNRGAGDRGWQGTIDEVRIYNRLLTASEIQTSMATPVSALSSAQLATQSALIAGGASSGITSSTTASSTDSPDSSSAHLQLAVKIGVFRPSTGQWYLDVNGNGQLDDCAIGGCPTSFGQPGNLPVAGDWMGSGAMQLGVFDPTTLLWQLDRNGNDLWDGCTVDLCLGPLWQAGDQPVVGRWTTTVSKAQLGIYRPSTRTWQLDWNGNGKWEGCTVDKCWAFGKLSGLPVVGDWTGSGTTKLGIFNPATGQWKLDRNGNGTLNKCTIDSCVGPFGLSGDLPVAGDWDGKGQAKIGVFSPSTGLWELDLNGNGVFDGCSIDACLGPFGQQGDLPVAGRW